MLVFVLSKSVLENCFHFPWSEGLITGILPTLLSLLPSFLTVPSNITGPPLSVVTVGEWEEVELVCVARGSPPPTITWSREESMLPVNSDQQSNTLMNEVRSCVCVCMSLKVCTVEPRAKRKCPY